MKWIDAELNKPKKKPNPTVWEKAGGESVRVILFSRTWGMSFGRYFHELDIWKVEGAHGDFNDITHFANITPPKIKTQ